MDTAIKKIVVLVSSLLIALSGMGIARTSIVHAYPNSSYSFNEPDYLLNMYGGSTGCGQELYASWTTGPNNGINSFLPGTYPLPHSWEGTAWTDSEYNGSSYAVAKMHVYWTSGPCAGLYLNAEVEVFPSGGWEWWNY